MNIVARVLTFAVLRSRFTRPRGFIMLIFVSTRTLYAQMCSETFCNIVKVAYFKTLEKQIYFTMFRVVSRFCGK